MHLYVLRGAIVASFALILSGPICVDCKDNFALDSAGFDYPKNVERENSSVESIL